MSWVGVSESFELHDFGSFTFRTLPSKTPEFRARRRMSEASAATPSEAGITK